MFNFLGKLQFTSMDVRQNCGQHSLCLEHRDPKINLMETQVFKNMGAVREMRVTQKDLETGHPIFGKCLFSQEKKVLLIPYSNRNQFGQAVDFVLFHPAVRLFLSQGVSLEKRFFNQIKILK